jgi:hypothetical protein
MGPETALAVMPFDDFQFLGKPSECVWEVVYCRCPQCARLVATLRIMTTNELYRGHPHDYLIWPRHAVTKPISPHVPTDVATDLTEARNVLADSPKSSAALSRRLLQRILVTKGGAKQGADLNGQIDAVLPTMPSYLQASLDGIRSVGNFAAHPLKSQHADTIFDVEPGEAEWSLNTLDDVIDFYYVRPAVEVARIAEHNKKRAEAGKPPMK